MGMGNPHGLWVEPIMGMGVGWDFSTHEFYNRPIMMGTLTFGHPWVHPCHCLIIIPPSPYLVHGHSKWSVSFHTLSMVIPLSPYLFHSQSMVIPIPVHIKSMSIPHPFLTHSMDWIPWNGDLEQDLKNKRNLTFYTVQTIFYLQI